MALIDRLINRTPRTETVTFPINPGDGDRYRQLQKAVTLAEGRLDMAVAEAVPDAQQRLDDAKAAFTEFEASTELVTFHLQAIGQAAVEKLTAQHPATKEQRTQARAAASGNPAAEPRVNLETFVPALIAASTARITSTTGDEQTGVTVDDLTRLFESAGWSDGDAMALFAAAQMVNQAPSTIDDAGKG